MIQDINNDVLYLKKRIDQLEKDKFELIQDLKLSIKRIDILEKRMQWIDGKKTTLYFDTGLPIA